MKRGAKGDPKHPNLYPIAEDGGQEAAIDSGDQEVQQHPLTASPDLTFPWRLFIMLQNSTVEDFEDVVSWASDGTVFKVHNHEKFAATVLPRFFQMKKYSSFTRQLYAYGFTWIREGSSKGAYFHPSFNRTNPSNCFTMERRTRKSTMGGDTKNRHGAAASAGAVMSDAISNAWSGGAAQNAGQLENASLFGRHQSNQGQVAQGSMLQDALFVFGSGDPTGDAEQRAESNPWPMQLEQSITDIDTRNIVDASNGYGFLPVETQQQNLSFAGMQSENHLHLGTEEPQHVTGGGYQNFQPADVDSFGTTGDAAGSNPGNAQQRLDPLTPRSIEEMLRNPLSLELPPNPPPGRKKG